jgi:regulator of protease activity HflC (stomatin/prohibitin superfamily)
MEINQQRAANREVVIKAANGWPMLGLSLALAIVGAASIPFGAIQNRPAIIVLAGIILAVAIVSLTGLFSLQPNEARVLVLFGNYKGTVRESGLHWANPFYSNGGLSAGGGPSTQAKITAMRNSARNKISLRARTLNGDKLKVNDKGGNPIEIAAVIVWRVEDTAQAKFDVDNYDTYNYDTYVITQSESALRHLANLYCYDGGEENEITLRSNVDEVSKALRMELEERLAKAGVRVDEARLTHLAYAPEIAQVMLRRQQAEAVIAARQKIVQGAVSMVDLALKELAEKDVVQLDGERRAAMVSNLMVVLCSESEVHPVVNTGTLYH